MINPHPVTSTDMTRVLEYFVMSDLPVQKEQTEGIARFFNRTSARSPADALSQPWQGRSSSAAGFSPYPYQSPTR